MGIDWPFGVAGLRVEAGQRNRVALMRLGFVVPAIGHVMVVLGFIALATPRPMESGPTEPVTVDIVPEDEVAAKETKPPLKFEFPEDKLTEKPETQAAKTQSQPEPVPQE